MRGDVLSVRALSTIAILALLSPPVVRPVAAGGVIAPDSDDDAEPSLLSSTGSTILLFGPRSRRPCTAYQLAEEDTEAGE